MVLLVVKRYDPGASRKIADDRLCQAPTLSDLSGSIESREIQASSDSDQGTGSDEDKAEGNIIDMGGGTICICYIWNMLWNWRARLP